MMRTIVPAVAIAVLLATTPVASAQTGDAVDLTETFRTAGATIDRLQVYEIAGIVLIRGRANDQAQAEAVGRIAQTLGYTRVANLVQIVEHNDEEIARAVEYELTANRSLDGCKFRVSAEQGVVRVAGRVQHELQKDVAAAVLRNIDGIRAVDLKLDRF